MTDDSPPTPPAPTRAGYVTVVGFPNAGKSTLLNRLVGETLAITSPKPQSTRHRIVGIRTADHAQMVVLDTPGLLEPRDALHTAMKNAALAALRDADVVLHVVDGTHRYTPLKDAANLTADPRAPVIVAFSKADLMSANDRARLADAHPDASIFSSVTREGIDPLVRRVTSLLPASPYLYPEDEISTQPVRFFCAELVRETALEQFGDEIPHAIACDIEEFREGSTPLYIRAVLHVERDSQKRIVIGAKGQQIKKLGKAARAKIERLVGVPVFLDLWVKVLPNWRRDAAAIRRLGYGDPQRRA